MTVALIIVACVAAAAVGGLVAALAKLSSSVDQRQAAVDRATAADRTQLLAERDRDQAVAARAQAERERDDAQTALVELQSLVVNQSKESVDRVKAQAAASPASAVDVVGELLAKPLPGVHAAADRGDAAGHDPGDE